MVFIIVEHNHPWLIYIRVLFKLRSFIKYLFKIKSKKKAQTSGIPCATAAISCKLTVSACCFRVTETCSSRLNISPIVKTRSIIRFLTARNTTAEDIHHQICQQYGPNAMSNIKCVSGLDCSMKASQTSMMSNLSTLHIILTLRWMTITYSDSWNHFLTASDSTLTNNW